MRNGDVRGPVLQRELWSLRDGGRHLPVRNRDLHFRHVLVEEILDLGEIVDARHHIERLAAAIALAQQRLADHQRIVRGDEGADREAVDWRSLDHRKLAQSAHRHLQRARDRRCGEGEHMNVGAKGLEPLFVGHSKMLLLIDDHQAEAFEFNALGEDRMSSDHDVDRAVGDAVFRLLGFPCRHEPRKATHI